jgi:hypothetical protein
LGQQFNQYSAFDEEGEYYAPCEPFQTAPVYKHPDNKKKSPYKGVKASTPSAPPTRERPRVGKYDKVDTRPPRPCYFCNEYHWMKHCQAYQDWGSRVKKAQQDGICYRCAKKGHPPSECTESRPCQACNGPHNIIFCKREYPVGGKKKSAHVVPALEEEEDPRDDYDKFIEEQGGLEEDDSFHQGAMRNTKPKWSVPPNCHFANRFPDIVDGKWDETDEEDFHFYYTHEEDRIDELLFYGNVTKKQHRTWKLARDSRLPKASRKGPVPLSKFKVVQAEESDADSCF